MKSNARIDRRRFLRTAATAVAAVLAAEWWWPWLRRGAPAPAEAVRLIDGGGLAAGQARALTLADTQQAVLVVRLDAASVVAFDRRCPHLGCPVQWSAARGRFECPCHAAAFEARSGHVLQGPPRRGLDPVAIELRGDEVWLRKRGTDLFSSERRTGSLRGAAENKSVPFSEKGVG
jgi:nitrite reductase/ring-hydroxylating ferredoxin subunit